MILIQRLALTILFLTMSASAEEKTFPTQKERKWKEVFSDDCSKGWQEKWFLDGNKARVFNSDSAMTIDTANGYAVLWTKAGFEGDLRIEYDFRRVDDNNRGVNIIYIQATGDGQSGHAADITQWSDRRTTSAMRDYFQNMHTYHISYAAYGNKPGNKDPDYVRARRYLPLANKGLKGTQLKNEYTGTGLFEDKQWIHVTLIKRDKELWMKFDHPDKSILCHFVNRDKPAIEKGRIGLRLMPGRNSQFRNFKVMTVVQ